MTRLTNPVPLFLDASGRLLDNGFVYVGLAGSDPQAAPLSLFWDDAMTIPAAQPLRTLGGAIVNGGLRSLVYFAQTDYSIRVRTADGVVVDYQPYASGLSTGPQYQPLDDDLTQIATQGTTALGRSLLASADAATLRMTAGVVDALPKAGGTVSGDIARQGAGDYLYWATGLGSGRVFLTATNAADPTSQAGDVWMTYAP